jgi:CRISPR-associated protein Cst2
MIDNKESTGESITHIAGTFLIDAAGSFLNGAGLGSGEDRNYTIVKTFYDGQSSEGHLYKVPFVSSQSWRRWLRDTLIEETNWSPSRIRALHNNARGNTDKTGGEFNPIEFPEDDIFGYMRAKKGSGKIEEVEENNEGEEEGEDEESLKEKEGTRIRGIFRTSPFSSSILVGLRKDGWEGRDQAYVHLLEGSAQPYKTQFMNTPLQGIFCLNYGRLGVFCNVGDKVELDVDDPAVKKCLDNKMVTLLKEQSQHEEYYSLEKTTVPEKDKKSGKMKQKEVFKQTKKHGEVYEIANAKERRKERASAVIKALAVLRGGAKQAAFGTDVSPKVLVMAGLTCGNPIFNSLFEDKHQVDKPSNSSNRGSNRGRTVILNIEALKEITTDYRDRIKTPVFIGIRTGYLQNEDEVRKLDSTKVDGIKFIVTTPITAARKMSDCLNADQSNEEQDIKNENSTDAIEQGNEKIESSSGDDVRVESDA